MTPYDRKSEFYFDEDAILKFLTGQLSPKTGENYQQALREAEKKNKVNKQRTEYYSDDRKHHENQITEFKDLIELLKSENPSTSP